MPARGRAAFPYRAIFENMQDGVLVLDAQEKLLDLNLAAQRILNRSRRQAVGQPVRSLIENWSLTLSSGKEKTHHVLTFGRPPRTYTVTMSALCLGAVGDCQVVELRDITEMRLRTTELSTLLEAARAVTSTLKLEDVLAAIAWQMILALNVDSCTLSRWDKEADTITTWAKEQRIPRQEREEPGAVYRLAEYPATRQVLERCQLLLVRASDAKADPAEAALLRSNQVQSVLMLPLSVGEQVLGLVELEQWEYERQFSEAEARLAWALAYQAAIAIQHAQLFEQVERLSMTDPLTGLFNRRHFFDISEREYRRAQRYHHPLTVCMVDVDAFKRVNDTYGHLVGDQILRRIAQAMRVTLRSSDFLCRYGGDEFAILMPETPLDAGVQAAERLLGAVVAQSVEADGQVVRISVSVGVAEMSPQSASLDALMQTADHALYAAKNAGKNRVAVWEEGNT